MSIPGERAVRGRLGHSCGADSVADRKGGGVVTAPDVTPEALRTLAFVLRNPTAGEPHPERVAAQLDAAAAQIEALRNERDDARAELAEAETDRDELEDARIALVAENDALLAQLAIARPRRAKSEVLLVTAPSASIGLKGGA